MDHLFVGVFFMPNKEASIFETQGEKDAATG